MIRGQLPIAMNGIGPMLPMQTITLPGGQTVQIPQINMEEINANLAAAGIAPIVSPPPTPAPTVPTPVPVPQVQDITIADPLPAPAETVGAGFDPTQG